MKEQVKKRGEHFTNERAGEDKKKAYLSIGVAVLGWSVAAYLCRFLQHVPVLEVIAIALFGGSLVGMFSRGVWLSYDSVRNRLVHHWPLILLLALNQVVYVYAFRSAPPAQVDLINYQWPALLILFEAWRGGRGIPVVHFWGMGICLMGLCLLLSQDLMEASFSWRYSGGYGAAFLAALSWTLYSSYGKTAGGAEELSTEVDLMVCSLSMACLQFFWGGWSQPSSSEWIALACLAVVSMGLPYPHWKRALDLGFCSTAARLGNVIPVLSIGWLVLGGEVPFTPILLVATFFMAVGCGCLSIAPSTFQTAS